MSTETEYWAQGYWPGGYWSTEYWPGISEGLEVEVDDGGAWVWPKSWRQALGLEPPDQQQPQTIVLPFPVEGRGRLWVPVPVVVAVGTSDLPTGEPEPRVVTPEALSVLGKGLGHPLPLDWQASGQSIPFPREGSGLGTIPLFGGRAQVVTIAPVEGRVAARMLFDLEAQARGQVGVVGQAFASLSQFWGQGRGVYQVCTDEELLQLATLMANQMLEPEDLPEGVDMEELAMLAVLAKEFLERERYGLDIWNPLQYHKEFWATVYLAQSNCGIWTVEERVEMESSVASWEFFIWLIFSPNRCWKPRMMICAGSWRWRIRR